MEGMRMGGGMGQVGTIGRTFGGFGQTTSDFLFTEAVHGHMRIPIGIQIRYVTAHIHTHTHTHVVSI